jgi:CBS domain-containing protein
LLLIAERSVGEMKNLLVRDLMHLGVVTCKHDASLSEVAQTMIDNGVHCVVVVDEAGEACGVVSDLGILEACDRDCKQMKAEDILHKCTVTVRPTASISAAAREMLERHIHHLVIMSEHPLHRPVGILAATDIVKAMARSSRSSLQSIATQ